MTNKKLGKITFLRLNDNNADLSHLEHNYTENPDGTITLHSSVAYTQEDINQNPQGCLKEMKEDAERIRNYCQTWFMFGVKAKIEVYIKNGAYTSKGKCWTIIEICSGGLWGIESDCGESYAKEIEQEELTELKQLLKVLGFSKFAIEKACLGKIERVEEVHVTES